MINKKKIEKQYHTLFYRDYERFEEKKFGKDLIHELQKIKNPLIANLKKHLSQS